MGRLGLGLILFVIWSGLCGEEMAFGISSIPLDGALSNLQGLLNSDVVKEVVKTFGMVFDHRPLEPATPLGTQIGLDLGVEVDLIQIPSSFGNALSAQGINTASLPILPSLRYLNFHKGLSGSVDFGASVLSFQGYLIWALEMKVAILVPDEGPTWAIRLSRNSTHVPIGSSTVIGSVLDISIDTVTWTPELVISRKLDFADPYIGIGYQYVTGGIKVSNTSGIDVPGISSTESTGGGGLAFIGLSLKPPNVGLRITLKGAYSTAGYNYMGSKVGFSF